VVLHCVQDDGYMGGSEARGGAVGPVLRCLREAGGDSLFETGGWVGVAESGEDLVYACVGAGLSVHRVDPFSSRSRRRVRARKSKARTADSERWRMVEISVMLSSSMAERRRA